MQLMLLIKKLSDKLIKIIKNKHNLTKRKQMETLIRMPIKRQLMEIITNLIKLKLNNKTIIIRIMLIMIMEQGPVEEMLRVEVPH